MAVGQICPVYYRCQPGYPTVYKNNSFLGTCIPRTSTVLDNYLLNEWVVEQIIAERLQSNKRNNEFMVLLVQQFKILSRSNMAQADSKEVIKTK